MAAFSFFLNSWKSCHNGVQVFLPKYCYASRATRLHNVTESINQPLWFQTSRRKSFDLFPPKIVFLLKKKNLFSLFLHSSPRVHFEVILFVMESINNINISVLALSDSLWSCPWLSLLTSLLPTEPLFSFVSFATCGVKNNPFNNVSQFTGARSYIDAATW